MHEESLFLLPSAMFLRLPKAISAPLDLESDLLKEQKARLRRFRSC
jgi:hypothetical protein